MGSLIGGIDHGRSLVVDMLDNRRNQSRTCFRWSVVHLPVILLVIVPVGEKLSGRWRPGAVPLDRVGSDPADFPLLWQFPFSATYFTPGKFATSYPR